MVNNRLLKAMITARFVLQVKSNHVYDLVRLESISTYTQVIS